MAKIRIQQYRYFKYAKWPHAIMVMQNRTQFVAVAFWLQYNLKKSQYRINYVKDEHSMFPNASTQVGYHLKYAEDLLALKLRFGL